MTTTTTTTDDNILKDGQTLRVGLMVTDSLSRSVAQHFAQLPVADATTQREKAIAAAQAREDWLSNAWRTPDAVVDADDHVPERTPRTLAMDHTVKVDPLAALEARDKKLSEAWRHA